MTLKDAVLTVLGETWTMTMGEMMYGLRPLFPLPPSYREISEEIDALIASGEVAQSFSHQIRYRKRTAAQLLNWLDVKENRQTEML